MKGKKMTVKTMFKILSLCSIAFPVTVLAEIKSISEIKAPAEFENIHVIKLATDKHSSDFVIFVKKQVPLHKHLLHTETVYVLEGTGKFQLGDEITEVGPGDFLKIPEGTPHAVTVTSQTPMKALSVQAPEFFGKDRVKVDN